MILFYFDSVTIPDGTALSPCSAVPYVSLNWLSIALGLFSEYTSKKH
jgi:hypothetical protein